jgi:hypothetical protein
MAWVLRVPAEGDPARADLWVRDMAGPRLVACEALSSKPAPAIRRAGSDITWAATTYKLIP